MTRRLFAAVATACVAACLWFVPQVIAGEPVADKSENESSQSIGRPVPVATLIAEQQERYVRTRHYTGSFVAARESRLAFERPGRVIRLLVDEGDAVTVNQPLAELDRRHLNAERRGVAAELAEAQAVLDELIAGPRKETIDSTEARVRSLTAQRDSASQNLDRRRRLLATRAISQEEFDDVQYDYRAAAAEVDAAQKELDELLAGTRKERIAAQRARVDQLRADLMDLDHDLEDATLRAPFAGVVAERMLDEGSIVAIGATVFRLIDQQAPELWVGLPASVAAQMKPGNTTPASINNQLITVDVRSLRPELDPTTRTRNVVFTAAADSGAVPGQIGRITLGEAVAETGFWVPTNALTPRKRGLWAVYVAVGDGSMRTVSARDVEVIHNDGDRSYVRGTLADGEWIIAAGAHRVVEGQRVSVDTGS